MPVIQPCVTCWGSDKGCTLKADFADRVRGLGLTVARFPCPIQSAVYHPGARVWATIRAATDGGEDVDDALVRATVIERSAKPGRFVIWPDPDYHEELDRVKSPLKLCALRSKQLEPAGEPDQPERVAELRALDRAQYEDEIAGWGA